MEMETGEISGRAAQRKLEHDWLHIAAIIGSCVMFIIAITFNGMAASGTTGVFLNNTGDLANGELFVEATPAGFVFGVTWALIYLCQVLFLGYSISLIFRRLDGPESPYLYTSQYGISIWVYLLYMLNMLLNLSWLLLWDRQYIWPAFVFIFAMQVTLYCKLYLVVKDFPAMMESLYSTRKWEVIMRLVFVHNALAIYAAWLSIAPLLNFASCLKVSAGMKQEDAATLALVILLVYLLVAGPLDLTILETRLRGIYLHYLPLELAPIGILVKINDSSNRNWIIALVICILAFLFDTMKFSLAIYRSCFKKSDIRSVTPETKPELA